jgi:hypothetical protein
MCRHKLAIHYAVFRNSHFLEVIILVADILGDSTEMLTTMSVALEASECCALVQRKGGFGRCGNINWAKLTKCNICNTSWPGLNEGGARYITISL